jgi:hypothetical protein
MPVGRNVTSTAEGYNPNGKFSPRYDEDHTQFDPVTYPSVWKITWSFDECLGARSRNCWDRPKGWRPKWVQVTQPVVTEGD